MLGSVLIGILKGSSDVSTSRSVAASARGMATRISCGCHCARIRARSRRLPSTGTPWIRWPTFAGSSSTKPIGAYW